MKPWSGLEENFLTVHKTFSIKWVANRMGRTVGSIKRKKTRLGLARKHNAWTVGEVALLMTGVSPPGHSKEACRRKLRRLSDVRKKSGRGTHGQSINP